MEEKLIDEQFLIKNGTILIKCYDKDGIDKVVIPDYITEIDYRAFFLSNYKEIIIPNSVTSIKQEAFCSCRNLKNIIIPSGVKEIGKAAFHGCSNLSNVIIQEGT